MVWVRALAKVIALCSWERHFTLTHSASPPRSINGYRQQNAGGNLRWTSIPSRGSSNTPSQPHGTETRVLKLWQVWASLARVALPKLLA